MTKTNFPPAPTWVRSSAAVIRHLPAGRYRTLNWLCRKPPSAFLMNMPQQMGGYSFHCDLRDTISREVCFTGRYEPQETALVRSILREGMTFVDVGANWGYFTLFAASLVGGNGRVISIEPEPRLFSILQENVTRSGLDQVTVLPLAAVDQVGTVMLIGYEEVGGNFGISRIAAKANGQEEVSQVSSDCLDHILRQQGIQSVDLMKMDIEGAEAFAIAGLQESLAEKKIKRLLLELHPIQLAEHGKSVSDVIQILEKAEYKAWTIDHSPVATRLAAYKNNISANALLRPLDSSAQFDSWPHQLWLAPNVE